MLKIFYKMCFLFSVQNLFVSSKFSDDDTVDLLIFYIQYSNTCAISVCRYTLNSFCFHICSGSSSLQLQNLFPGHLRERRPNAALLVLCPSAKIPLDKFLTGLQPWHMASENSSFLRRSNLLLTFKVATH